MTAIHTFRHGARRLLLLAAAAAACVHLPAAAQDRMELSPYFVVANGDSTGGIGAGLQVAVPVNRYVAPLLSVESWTTLEGCAEESDDPCVWDTTVYSAGLELRSPRLLLLRYLLAGSVGVAEGEWGFTRSLGLGAELGGRTWGGRFLLQHRSVEDADMWAFLLGLRFDVGIPGR